jgi:class 3 adenylate cyclase
MLKHIGIAALDPSRLKIRDYDLFINGAKVPLNDHGESIVNWGSRKEYFKNTYAILDLIENRREGHRSTRINGDSIVVFLPMMFTGNADFKETFVGQLPGGYVQVAALNSALTGKWLRNIDPSLPGILLGIAVAMLSALIHRNYSMIGFGLIINAVYFMSVGAAFVYGGWLLEWMNGWIAFNLTLVPIIVFSEVAAEIRSIRMNDALAGVLSPKMLAQISKAPEAFTLAAAEQIVTVMFVDFVGFSKLAEQRSSREVFESLRKHFAELGAIIHKYHGIVDKSLGDGLLGVFGFDPVTHKVSSNHADDAANCALEIQKFMALECASFKKSELHAGAVIFAARIGLNTGVAFIGNIGEQGRLDLTVIGHAVNLGKRYEDACEPFKILMGPNTEQYLGSKLKNRLLKRDLQIKHHKELLHSYELDPFLEEENLYNDAVSSFRNFANISRSDERIMVPPGQSWELRQGGIKAGHVVDYSKGGMCADLSNFYANKVTIICDLFIKSEADDRVLHEILGLNLLVRWGRKGGAGFRHGLGLSDESAARFNRLFAESHKSS